MSAVAARKAALAAQLASQSPALSSPSSSALPSPATTPAPSPGPSRASSATPKAVNGKGKKRARETGVVEEAESPRSKKKRNGGEKSGSSVQRSKQAARRVAIDLDEGSDEEEEYTTIGQQEDEVDEDGDAVAADFGDDGLLASASSSRPRKNRYPEIAEGRHYSNFRPEEGRSYWTIRSEQLQALPEVYRYGSGALISLSIDEYITFSGSVRLTPLRLPLRFFSSTLHPAADLSKSSSHRVFAPLTHPLPVITHVAGSSGSGSSRAGLSWLREELGVPEGMLSEDRTVFLVQELDSGIEGLERAVGGMGKLWGDGSGTGAVKVPGFYPLVEPVQRPIYQHITPQSWQTAFNIFLSSPSSDPEAYNLDYDVDHPEIQTHDSSMPILAIVKGPKRSGKSTFARELANTLLERYERVAYLDCDLGQSEFGPGGSVGLFSLDGPVLGPSFTHPLLPVRSHFVGSHNPRLQSEYYLSCVNSLLEYYRFEMQYDSSSIDHTSEKITEVVPLVINTQGWVKGLGADLLQRIESLVQATHTFSFVADTPGAGGEGETGFGSEWEDSRRYVGEDYDFQPEAIVHSGYGMVVPLEPAPKTALQSKYPPTELRTLAMLSYLYSRVSSSAETAWEFSASLLEMVPWEVRLDEAVKEIYLTGEGADAVLPEDLGLALNGSIVALIARIEPSADPLPSSRYIMGRPLPPPAETHCVGLGLVRGISPDASSLHLLTPVPPSSFSQISILIKGEIELPLAGSLDWRSADDDAEKGPLGLPWEEIPYVTTKPEVGVGMGRRRFRRNIMRKGQVG